MHRLPSRIATVMTSTVVLFVLTMALTVAIMVRTLDRQALDQSITQMSYARTALLLRVRTATLDYANWDLAVEEIAAGDSAWIYENIGSVAFTGKTVQLATLWGRPFPAPIGWTVESDRAPRPDVLDPDLLEAVERRIESLSPSFNGIEFFGWRNGSLYAFGAARFAPIEGPALPVPGAAGQIVMGIRVHGEPLAEIADSLLLSDVRLMPRAPADGPAVSLAGVDGRPVAYLTWSVPRPGTDMLWRMLPLLSIVTLAATGMAVWAMRLMRRNAVALVSSEHASRLAASTDALTGLPNRAAFTEVLAQPSRPGERAILFLDLNGFKSINDSAGHAAGDRVIAAVADRLAAFRGPDCFIARISGDEFVLVATGPDTAARVEPLAHAVERVFVRPFDVMGRQLRLRAAIGYAVQEALDLDGEQLLRRADLAMYEAKRHKNRGPVAFTDRIAVASDDASAIEQGLRAALADPESFTVAYQPIVTPDGRFERAEALARWDSPELGSVPPSRFVAVAESAGLIAELGQLLFSRVCDDLAANPTLRVSVNVSPLQLVAADFIETLVSELRARGIDPARIEVELTESVLVTEPALAAKHLRALQRAGFSIALDDFGTGYSSIAYLDQLSLNTLKLDRSFASALRSSQKRHELIRSMIQMAHGLDLRVVCEGVETAEDLRTLADLDCDLVQGFLFDEPCTIDVLRGRWLEAPAARVA